VIYLSTFSKTLAPGLRLGWVSAPEALLRSIAVTKQGTDLHTGTLAQRSAATLLEDLDCDGHVVRRAGAGDGGGATAAPVAARDVDEPHGRNVSLGSLA
jgi:histidinol-phosphate/aromatic aminotransferase/cobyric acid decarboxylase-like protein